MEVEDKMKRIKESQRQKKVMEDEVAMKRKQEILAQVLGLGANKVPPKKEDIEPIKEEIDDYFGRLREESQDFLEESGVSASLNDRDSDDDDDLPEDSRRNLMTLDDRQTFNPSETLAYSEASHNQIGTFLSESSQMQQLHSDY